MHHIKANHFCLPETGQMEFTFNYIESTVLKQSEPHIHRDCEIYVNLSGDVSFEVEGRIYPVSRGSVIITRPYEYHHCILHSNTLHTHYWITFSAHHAEDYLTHFFQRQKGQGNLILLSEENLAEFQAIARFLLQDKTDPLQQRIGVLKILDMLRTGDRIESIGNLEYLPRDVVTALLYMDEHLTEDMDIKTVATLCGVSINTLERHCKQALGDLPAQVLRKKRLFASMQHLRNGETITNAALKSGFSDYSHYIQLFKKQFGITPLQYKKNFETK